MARAGLFLMLVPFSVLAAIMGFLITYHEMRQHHRDKKQPVFDALRTAIFVLIFFLALSWLVVTVLLAGGR
jgi:ABC-type transport system involved in cytochrome c biogenesis permease subunit